MARRRDDSSRYIRDISASAFRVLRGILTNALATISNAGAAVASAAGSFYRWLTDHFPNDAYTYRQSLDITSHQYQSNQASADIQRTLYLGGAEDVPYPIASNVSPGYHLVVIWTGEVVPGQGNRSFTLIMPFNQAPTSQDILDLAKTMMLDVFEQYEVEDDGQIDDGVLQIVRAERG